MQWCTWIPILVRDPCSHKSCWQYLPSVSPTILFPINPQGQSSGVPSVPRAPQFCSVKVPCDRRCSLPPTLSSHSLQLQAQAVLTLQTSTGWTGLLRAAVCQLLRGCKACATRAHSLFLLLSHSLVQMNTLSFPKTKSECNSLYMVKSSFHTNTLSTLRCCWFGFTWHDPFLSSLFPAVCPTVTCCGRVYNKFNVQKVPCYGCLPRFLIRTLKGNGHKAL